MHHASAGKTSMRIQNQGVPVGSVLGQPNRVEPPPASMMTTNIASHTSGFGGGGGASDLGVGSSTGMETFLQQAGNQPAATHSPIPVTGNGYAVVVHRLVSVDDQVGPDIMFW